MKTAEREALIAAVQDDWRTAALTPAQQVLCAYAEKLTLRPSEITEADLEPLRAAGFDVQRVFPAQGPEGAAVRVCCVDEREPDVASEAR